MKTPDQARFDQLYQSYLNELTLQGKSDRTVDGSSRCIRQIAKFFEVCPDNLTTEQLKVYFLDLVKNKSWSAVKIARNALQLFYQLVLERPREWVNIVKPPKQQPIQDVLSLVEVEAIINATRELRYQVYYLVTYSLGLRLNEALHLKVSDIDSHMMRVHVRFTQSKRDRFVPLPLATLQALRRYWQTHRHPELIFPCTKLSLDKNGEAKVMNQGGVQKAIKIIARECGISKNVHVHTLRH